MKNSEILDAIRFYKRFTTKKAFAEHLGIKANVLSNWYTRNTFDKDIILNKIPEINRTWLLTGEGEMLNHPHNEATYNTKNNNGGDNIYINNNGGSISNSGNTTGGQEAPGQHNGQGQEIKEMTKLFNQLHETKIIEIDRLTKLYNGIISNQNEFIDTLKEQNSQYRKEIESLRQRIKGNTENNKE